MELILNFFCSLFTNLKTIFIFTNQVKSKSEMSKIP